VAGVGLLAPLARDGDRPLERQLEERLREAIGAGRLGAGVRVPSTRRLAAALHVSRNVVASSYAQLIAQGWLTARHGAGTFVCDRNGSPAQRPAPGRRARWMRDRSVARAEVDAGNGRGVIDLRRRGGTLAPLPPVTWRRAWRSAVADMGTSYGEPRGDARLRRATAGFVARTRGVLCSADDVVITSGASDAISLVLHAVLEAGDTVAVEEPGYQSVRRVAQMHGASVLELPVDDGGADIGRLPRGAHAPIAVHVTPAHHYPLGVELGMARRSALLAWAKAEGAIVIENDYGGEFNFAETALPALAALDRAGVVAFIGTFSRLLAPGLRLGYVVGPRPLLDQVATLKREIDDYASTPTQRAVAHLIEERELERHLRRVRRLVEYKRERLAHGLAPLDGRVRVAGLGSGLHVAIELLDGTSAERVARRARAHGVLLETLEYHRAGATPDRLLLDYGAVEPSRLEKALGVLCDSVLHAA
jgi:GntR family transcriptional regulator/MocR family aminotransferase